MFQQVPAPCPLCDAQATYIPVSSPVGKRFTCPTCKAFFMDHVSETEMGDMPEMFRSEFRAQGNADSQKSGPGETYVIRETRPGEGGIITEWVRSGRTIYGQ
ncbi:MAG: hypothetical protein EOP82_14620 [Variovorax sp.]|nr:MAG: hypothetical protein EOP82_14620 [Variovorax sp.]